MSMYDFGKIVINWLRWMTNHKNKNITIGKKSKTTELKRAINHYGSNHLQTII